MMPATIDPVMRAKLLGQTPAPAAPVVTLPRHLVETILAELEEANPLRSLVIELRAALATPEDPLWCLYTPGPGEVFPFPSKEDAEAEAKRSTDYINAFAAREKWDFVPVFQVIPSPFTPAEHFEIMAEQARQDLADLRALTEQEEGEQ